MSTDKYGQGSKQNPDQSHGGGTPGGKNPQQPHNPQGGGYNPQQKEKGGWNQGQQGGKDQGGKDKR